MTTGYGGISNDQFSANGPIHKHAGNRISKICQYLLKLFLVAYRFRQQTQV